MNSKIIMNSLEGFDAPLTAIINLDIVNFTYCFIRFSKWSCSVQIFESNRKRIELQRFNIHLNGNISKLHNE